MENKPVRKTKLSLNFPGAVMMGKEERAAAIEVINSQSLFRYYGPKLLRKVEAFENAFAKYNGVRFAHGVNSGTAALIDGMAALGIGPGDEVILPAVTFIACVGAVVACNAIPVFADIDESLSIDPYDIENRITERTKAIMVVHVMGVSADMDRILETAKKHNLKVIEDCAQSCGAEYKGRKVGSMGDAGCFSFQLNKTITSGEGGIVTTNDENIYNRAARYHDHGYLRKTFLGRPVVGASDSDRFFGVNMRMNEITGAIMAEQLKKLPKMLKTMKNIHKYLRNKLKDVKEIKLRDIPDKKGDSCVSLGIILKTEEQAIKFNKLLEAENIGSYRLYGGKPVYFEPQVMNKRTANGKGCPFNCGFYKNNIEYKPGMCPVSENIAARALFINFSPLIKKQDADDIFKAVKKTVRFL